MSQKTADALRAFRAVQTELKAGALLENDSQHCRSILQEACQLVANEPRYNLFTGGPENVKSLIALRDLLAAYIEDVEARSTKSATPVDAPKPAAPETVAIDKVAHQELLEAAREGQGLLRRIGNGQSVLLVRQPGEHNYDGLPTHENTLDVSRRIKAALSALTDFSDSPPCRY